MGISVSSDKIIQFLISRGFVFLRANGTSHHIYAKGNITVPIPVHKGKDLAIGTLRSIIRIAKLDWNDFRTWLGR
jgi:predicted RNA binding protein YcfA (HicA-like mRNA interferase family)